VTVEHWYLIADEQRGALEKLMDGISFLDVASAVLMDGDGDLETGMSCSSTWQKERSDSRGSHTENDLALSTEFGSNELAEICLATSTCAMHKVGMSRCLIIAIHCIFNHCIKDLSLLLVEGRHSSIHSILENVPVIVQLLYYELVALPVPPVHMRARHVREVHLQRLGIFVKKTINEIETIVMDLLWSGILYVQSMNETVMQIIAEIILEVVPKQLRACREAVQEYDDKKTAQVMSSAHMRGFSQALLPFSIIIKETSELTCFLESSAKMIINCAKVFIGGSPFKNPKW